MTFKDTVEALHTEVVTLAFVWRLYRDMFATKGNVERMNKLSGTTFGLVQRAMIADLIRRVCAITDPPGAAPRKNLVLRLAAETLQAEQGCLPVDIVSCLDTVDTATASIRQHRNKSYAHLDLLTKQRQGANLPKVINADLDAAIDAVFEAMGAIYLKCNGRCVVYQCPIINNAGGEFEWLLKDALRFARLRELAADERVSDPAFRELARHRSSRLDTEVLGTSTTDVVIDDEEPD